MWARRRRYRLANQEFGLVQVRGSLQSGVEIPYYRRYALRKRSGTVLDQVRNFLPHEWCRVNEPWQSASRSGSGRRKLTTSERVELPQE